MTAPAIASAFNVLCDTRYGKMLCNRHDTYVGGSIQRYGEFSEGEAELFRLVIPVGGVVIEAGANIGALTVPIAQHVGPDGMVLAYEPQRLAFQLLNANVALNSLTNVVTRQAAIGSTRGTLPIPFLDPTTTNNVGGLEVRGHEHGEPVPLMPLDEYGDLPRLDFLKADVEGMELAVVLGARRLITTHWPMLYLEADRPVLLPALVGTLEQYGYRMWLHRPPLFSPNNFNGKPDSIFVQNDAEVVSINLLCIHQSQDVPPEVSDLSVPHLVRLVDALKQQQGAQT